MFLHCFIVRLGPLNTGVLSCNLKWGNESMFPRWGGSEFLGSRVLRGQTGVWRKRIWGSGRGTLQEVRQVTAGGGGGWPRRLTGGLRLEYGTEPGATNGPKKKKKNVNKDQWMQKKYGKGRQNQTSTGKLAHASYLAKQTRLIDVKLCGTWWPSALTTECAQHGSRAVTLTQSGKMWGQADLPWVLWGFEAH